MPTAEPLERYFHGIPDLLCVDRLNTDRTPTAAGHVRVNATGDVFQWWGDTDNEVKTALHVGREQTSIIRPFQLSALDIVSTAAMPVLTRAAAGLWYWERIATGAETLYFSGLVPYKIETASRGAKLTGLEIAYELATANLTSLDVRVDSVVYAQATNPVVTNSHGGAIVDGDYDAAHDTAAERIDSTVANGEHLLTLTLNTPAYYVTANGEVRFEIAVVMQNTGVFRLRTVHGIYTEAQN